MDINRNEFVTAFAFALDFLEAGLRKNVTNHNKRVSLIAVCIGEVLGLDDEALFDLYAYACLHDNGITHQVYNVMSQNGHDRLEGALSHCITGEQNLSAFPFLHKRDNVIKYHHEAYDGGGFFGISGDSIPLFSQIIALSDMTEIMYRSGINRQEIINRIMKTKGGKFSAPMTEAFRATAMNTAFWLSLDDMFILDEIKKKVPMFIIQAELAEMLPIAEIMSGIIDAKSPFTGSHSKGIAFKTGVMADYYNFDNDKKVKMLIAANLHDVGKLAIPNNIIDKPDKLTDSEFESIKTHTFYTRKVFESVKGFEDVTEWASNHHERLDGSGYPYGLNKDKLSFEAQLITCMDIYQALTEERPYRSPLSHIESTAIMNKMVKDGAISGEIVEDIMYNCGRKAQS